MSETPTEDQPYPWLPLTQALAWVKVDAGTDKVANVDLARRGACSWVQDQRPDLFTGTGDDRTFAVTDRVLMATLLSVARLVARIDSPNGVVSFNELGAGSILATDPDVKRLLGHRRPMAG